MRSAGRSKANVLAVVAMLALVGCGSSGSGDSPPAALAPATSPVYAEVVIDPEGDQESALRGLLAKFPGGDTDPSTKVGELVQQGFDESGRDLSYSEDVQPWLGDRMGLFASGAAQSPQDVGLVVATTDADAAEAALDKLFPDGEPRETGEFEYRLSEMPDDVIGAGGGDPIAAGIVEGFAVIASEDAFIAAAEAASGTPLAESESYESAIESLPDERLASIYVDTSQLAQLAANDRRLGADAPDIDALSELEPTTGSLTAEGDALVFDTTTTMGELSNAALAGRGTDLLEQLPADSFFAAGIPGVGQSLSQTLESAGGAGGFDPQMIFRLLESETGINPQRDLLDWLGDVAFFALGRDLSSVGGGVVIESEDPAASGRAVGLFERLLEREEGVRIERPSVEGVEEGFAVSVPGLPLSLNLVQKESQVVIALGDHATAQALAPSHPLGEAPEFSAAVDSLGEDYVPSTYVAADAILVLVQSLGAAEDPTYQQIEPYVSPFEYVVAGTRADGDRVLSRARIQFE